MFTQPCFIRKNTKELVEKLEKLGYDYAENGAGAWFIPLCKLEYLGVNLYSKGYYMGVNGNWNAYWIDCGTNEDLFLALAALRDDTDKNQWFIYNSTDAIIESARVYEWFVCNEDRIEDMLFYDCHYLNTHKATPQELIEHFKDK